MAYDPNQIAALAREYDTDEETVLAALSEDMAGTAGHAPGTVRAQAGLSSIVDAGSLTRSPISDTNPLDEGSHWDSAPTPKRAGAAAMGTNQVSAFDPFDGVLSGGKPASVGGDFDPFEGVLGVQAPSKPKSRTIGETLYDGVAQVAAGINNAVAAPFQLAAPEGDIAQALGAGSKYWQDKQSGVTRERAAAADKEIQKVYETEGLMSAIPFAVKRYGADPVLFQKFILENLPSMAPGLGAAKAASAVGGVRAGLAAGSATNAVMNGGGARGDAFEDIKTTLLNKYDISEADATEAAVRLSRMPAVVGTLAGAVSGGTGLESVIAGVFGKGGWKGFLRKAGTELGGEQVEEVTPKLATNWQVQDTGVDPNRKLGEGVAQTVGQTFVASSPGAVVAGALGAAGEGDPKLDKDTADLTKEYDAAYAAWQEAGPAKFAQRTDTEVAGMAKAGNVAASFEEKLREQNKAREDMIKATMAADAEQEGIESRPMQGLTDRQIRSGLSAIEFSALQNNGALTDEQDRVLARAGYEVQQRQAEAEAAAQQVQTEQEAAEAQRRIAVQRATAANIQRLLQTRIDETPTQESENGLQVQGQEAAQEVNQLGGGTVRAQLGGTVTPDIGTPAAPMVGPTVADALQIMRTPGSLADRSNAVRLNLVRNRIGENAFALLEQAATAAFTLSMDQRSALKQLVETDAATPPAPVQQPGTLGMPATQQALQDETGERDANGMQASRTRDDFNTLRSTGDGATELDGAGSDAQGNQQGGGAGDQRTLSGITGGRGVDAGAPVPGGATNIPVGTGRTDGALNGAETNQAEQTEPLTSQQKITRGAGAEFAANGLTEVKPTQMGVKGLAINALMQRVAKAFGKQVIWYKGNVVGGKAPPGGFINRDVASDAIFLNVGGDINPMAVFGHELLHHLAADMPAAFEAIANQLKLPQETRDRYKGYGYNGEAVQLEEVIADLSGEMLMQAKTWENIFQQIIDAEGDKAKPIIERLRDVVIKMINQILARIGGMRAYGIESDLQSKLAEDQLRSVKKAIESAFAQYLAANQRGDAMAKSDGGLKTKTSSPRKEFTNQTLPTRWPTSKKLDPAPTVNDPMITDLETLKQDQKQYEKAIDALIEEPGMGSADIVRGTLDEKAEHVIERMKANLLWLYDQVPHAIRERSKLWYDGARKIAEAWAERYDISESQAAGMLAVLSPQKDWFMNVTMAERVLDIIHTKMNHTFDAKMDAAAFGFLTKESMKEDPDSQKNLNAYEAVKGKTLREVARHNDLRQMSVWIRAYDEAYHDAKHAIVTPEGGFVEDKTTMKGEPTLRAWGDFTTPGKAASIYLNGTPENINRMLGGEHKVRNFYNNIYAPHDARFTTIDTHAVAADMLRALAGADKPVAENFGKTGGTNITGLSGTYALHYEAYRRAAEDRDVLPREMQSITWEAVRGLFTEGFKGKKDNVAAIDAVWNDVDAGKITARQARNRILNIAGGINNPDWYSEGNAEYKAVLRDKTYKQERGAFHGAKVTFEVAPDPRNTELKTRWDALPQQAKNEISHKVAWKIAAKALASFGDENMKGELHGQLGGWLDDTNPSLSIWFNKRAAASKINEFARMLGFALNQMGMMRTSQRPFKGVDGKMVKPSGAVLIAIPTDADVNLLYQKIRGIVDSKGKPYVFGHTTGPGQMAIIHTDEKRISTEDLARKIADVIGDDYRVGSNQLYVEFLEKGRGSYGLRGKNGLSPGSPLRARSDQLRAESGVILDQLIGEYESKGKFSRNRPDAASDRRAGELADGGSQEVQYGQDREGVRPLKAVHYSGAERSVLDGRMYGTGAKGAEAARVASAKDARLKKRIYFYVDRGNGIRPEQGVGSVAHGVTLNNVYDADSPKIQQTVDRSLQGNDWMNAFESAVLDAGYDGYVADFGNQRAVVLMGEHQVPVKKVGGAKFSTRRFTAQDREDVRAFWLGYSSTDEAFQYATSPSKSMDQIVKDTIPGGHSRDVTSIYENTLHEGQRLFRIGIPYKDAQGREQTKDGFITVDDDTKEAWVNVASIGEGFQGSRIYNLAGNWAINNGYVFIGDPADISVAGMKRRTENMVSQALKWGTTSHLKPHPKQVAWIEQETEVPFNWKPGNSLTNFDELLQASYNLTVLDAPEIANVTYDTLHQKFVKPDGTEADLKGLAKRAHSQLDPVRAEGAAGEGTLKRTALTNTLLQEPAGPGRRRLLDKLGEVGLQHNPVTGKLLYSLPRQQPWYYSALEDGIKAMPSKVSGTSAANVGLWLKSNADKLKIKKDEIEWSGVMDYLAMRGKDKITADELAQWVAGNGVKVTETVLGNNRNFATVEDAIKFIADKEGKTPEWVRDNWGYTNDRDYYDLAAQWDDDRTSTKFHSYVLPGGENYKELLITLPGAEPVKVNSLKVSQRDDGNWHVLDRSGDPVKAFRTQEVANEYAEMYGTELVERSAQFQSSHFDQPNILAHIRMNERTDAEGNKVLFIEEIQSDWGQKGKKEGFADPTSPVYAVFSASNYFLKSFERKAEAEAFAESVSGVVREEKRQPGDDSRPATAPFVTDTKSWTSLALKRAIAYAVDNGFDKIAWTTGEQQADRYDLSKKVDGISHRKAKDGNGYEVQVIGGSKTIWSSEHATESELEDVVGKEIAKKIADNSKPEWNNLSGLDLKVGGEGMKGFYDMIVPSVAKKLGAEVGSSEFLMRQHESGPSSAWNSFEKPSVQPSFTITPAMREQAGGKGMPLFSHSRVEQWAQTVADGRVKEPTIGILSKLGAALNKGGIFRPIVMDYEHAKHTMNTHAEITPEVIGSLESLLPDPRAVVRKSAGKWQVIIDSRDQDGNPLSVGLQNDTITGGKDVLKVTEVATLYGTNESASELAQHLLAGRVTYMPKKELARVRGLIDDATQPSEALLSGDQSPIQKRSSASPTPLNSEREVSVQTETGIVKFVLPTDAPSMLRGAKFSKNRNAFGDLDQAEEQALKNLGGITQPKTWKDRLNDLMKINIRQGLVDQFAPIRDMDQRSYMLSRLSKGAEQALEAALMYGKVFLNGDAYDVKVEPDGGFAKVLSDLDGEHDRFLWWVAAQRADGIKQRAAKAKADLVKAQAALDAWRDVRRQQTDAAGYKAASKLVADLTKLRDQLREQASVDERLFSNQDIKTLLNLNRGREAKFKKALDKLNEYNNSVLEIAKESGLVDQAAVDMFRDQPYVPFYRVLEDGQVQGGRMSSGMTSQYAWKKLKGGTEKLNEDLLANMLMNWSHIYQSAARNRASAATLSAAVKAGVATEVTSGTQGSVKVMVDGKQKSYVLDDPYIAEAIAALEWAMPKWMKPLSDMKRILTFGVTVSPFFKVKNLIRDSVSAIGQSELSGNPFKNVAAGWAASHRKGQTYASMLAGGGAIRFGTTVEDNRAKSTRRTIEKMQGHILDKNGFAKLAKMGRDVFDWYQEVGDKSENINRAALYDQLIKKGYSHAEASFMSRDLLDFSMSGRWPVVRFLAQTVPFLNARLQGLYKLGRAGAENPTRLGYVTGAVIAASLALYALQGDDEDWKNREDWDRDTYWWIKIGQTAFRIPKPFEIGTVGTLAERTAEAMFSDEPDSWKRWRGSISRSILSTFAMDPTPAAVKPLLEVGANEDSFGQRPIETMAMQKLLPEDRYTDSTSQTAIALGQLGVFNPMSLLKGKAESFSPVQIEHMIRAYFGWAGSTSVGTLDILLRPALGKGDRPDRDWLDWVSGKMVDEVGKADSSRYVSAYYETLKQVAEIKASHDAAKKPGGDPERADEIKADFAEELARYPKLHNVEAQIGYLTRQAKKIAADKEMDADVKREKIDAINAKKKDVAQKALARIGQPG